MATIALAACSGSGGGDAARATATERAGESPGTAPGATPTMPTTAATTVPTTAAPAAAPANPAADPPPYSFDGSVPPPPVVDRGDDFGAVYRSFERYLKWLVAHRPDPELLRTIGWKGGEFLTSRQEGLRWLADRDHRYYEVGSRVERVEVAGRYEPLGPFGPRVDLRVYHAGGHGFLVERDGTVVDEADVPDQSTWLVSLLSSPGGPWRIGAIYPVGPTDTVVEL